MPYYVLHHEGTCFRGALSFYYNMFMFSFQALDGFIMVFSSSGRIFYASESITSLLGHLPVSMSLITKYFFTTL